MATRGLTVLMQHRIVADVQAVVRHLVDVHRADLVGRMDQLVLDVPGQVAEVEEAEVAVAEQEAEALGVVALVLGLRLVVLGDRVLRRARLVGDHLAVAAQAEQLAPARARRPASA